MNRATSTLLSTLFFAASLAIPGTSQAAPAHSHDAHAAHGKNAGATLQLNAGKKWATDAALRQSMGNIRQSIAGALDAIHENRLPTAEYKILASRVENEVGSIVANCKLEPKADAQLHLIVAELLAGADQMAGKIKQAKPLNGALKVIGALEKYATYFDDAQFKPIAH